MCCAYIDCRPRKSSTGGKVIFLPLRTVTGRPVRTGKGCFARIHLLAVIANLCLCHSIHRGEQSIFISFTCFSTHKTTVSLSVILCFTCDTSCRSHRSCEFNFCEIYHQLLIVMFALSKYCLAMTHMTTRVLGNGSWCAGS